MRTTLLVACLALAYGAGTAGGSEDRPDLSESAAQRLHKELFAEAAAQPWRTIPWKSSVTEALAEAKREGKPLLGWASHGPPLTCG